MLLAFLPFIVFAVFDRVLGVVPALCAAAALSAVFLVRDWLTPGRTVKVLEIGTVLLFGGLAVYALVAHTEWSLLGVRLRVDAGLLVVVLASMLIGQPFTQQYAKERTPPEVWARPGFKRVNHVITAAWAVAFALMVLADVAMIYVPALPLWVGIAVTIAAIVGAIRFTQWYPEHMRAKFQAAG
jgi:intracellular septation protein A